MDKFIKIIFLVILNFSLLLSFPTQASEKLKIGLMVPLTGSQQRFRTIHYQSCKACHKRYR
jgi:hypothetical protein